jgi:DNA-binding NarL/FixJ family response regulator
MSLPHFDAAAQSRDERLCSLQALVVDRDGTLGALLGGWLRELGIRPMFARSLAEALDVADDCGPDLVLIDLDVAQEEGAVRLARSARSLWGAAVVLIGGSGESAAARILAAITALEPHGALCKPFHRHQLQLTLHLALRRQTPGAPTEPQIVDLLSRLRRREQEVVRLLLEHHRVPAIADRLCISPLTVRNHLKGAFKRLGVHSQQELLERLYRARQHFDPMAAPATQSEPMHVD